MEWQSVEPEHLPPKLAEVLISIRWLDIPCVAYRTNYGWVASREHLDGEGICSNFKDYEVEGWMELPKAKWAMERDA